MSAGASIAIVDDDDSLRHSLVRLFRSAGYSVEAFASATEFLSALSQWRPACVILDLQLPVMTGQELLRRLSVFANPPPVVVITGNDDECLRDECIALGGETLLPQAARLRRPARSHSRAFRACRRRHAKLLIATRRPSRLR
jgi:FixJ family two-component response regulator